MRILTNICRQDGEYNAGVIILLYVFIKLVYTETARIARLHRVETMEVKYKVGDIIGCRLRPETLWKITGKINKNRYILKVIKCIYPSALGNTFITKIHEIHEIPSLYIFKSDENKERKVLKLWI